MPLTQSNTWTWIILPGRVTMWSQTEHGLTEKRACVRSFGKREL